MFFHGPPSWTLFSAQSVPYGVGSSQCQTMYVSVLLPRGGWGGGKAAPSNSTQLSVFLTVFLTNSIADPTTHTGWRAHASQASSKSLRPRVDCCLGASVWYQLGASRSRARARCRRTCGRPPRTSLTSCAQRRPPGANTSCDNPQISPPGSMIPGTVRYGMHCFACTCVFGGQGWL